MRRARFWCARPAQNETATFTPTDSIDYSTVVTSVFVNVAPAPLVITADNATMVAGQPVPSFNVDYSGFVLGQGPAALNGTLSVTTSVTASSPAGSYSIVPSGLTSSNYAITYKDGTLTVAPTTTSPPVEVTSAQWESVRVSRKKSTQVLDITYSGPISASDAVNPNAYTMKSAYTYKKALSGVSRSRLLLDADLQPGNRHGAAQADPQGPEQVDAIDHQ